jgi:VWFA-related protein
VTVIATLLLAAAQQASPLPVFGVDASLVRVDVAVSRDGAPILGLRNEDFELRDNGVPQTLEPMLTEQVPVDMVLVLDLSDSVAGAKLSRLRDAASGFLAGLRADERAALIGFSEEVLLVQDWTSDRERLRAAVEGITGRGSTALRHAVYAGLRLGRPGGRRTAVVVCSDGVDNFSWLRDADVLEAARRSEAVLYGIVARGREEREHVFLRKAATATGGRVFAADERDLRARFLEVLQDVRDRYVLSFSPAGVSKTGWHKLEVRLRGGRGQVLARPGYWRPAR